jgi:GNAT superfamily N-acetyltransferase
MFRGKDAMSFQICPATLDDLDALAHLFDAYRVFYKRPSDPAGAWAYLHARLERVEATVFIAVQDGRAVGFTLLYDTFTSVAMRPLTILNDLYTIPEARGQGVATALIARAAQHAREHGSAFLRLRTANDNLMAQSVFERIGFKRDEVFFTYDLDPTTEIAERTP